VPPKINITKHKNGKIMTTAVFIKMLILMHVSLGAISLIAGLVAIFTKKGQKPHIISGRVFYYSLGLSILISLIVASTPGKYNPFLFSIGIFSGYFILIGKRAIQYKKSFDHLSVDRIIHIFMFFSSVAMVLTPIILFGKFHPVAGVVGIAGIIFAIRNFRTYDDMDKLKQNWLKIHIGHISGGYISAVSAFFVVNNILPSLLNWFLPSIIGGIFIAMSLRKVDTKSKILSSIPKKSFILIGLLLSATFGMSQNDGAAIPFGREIGVRIGLTNTKLNDQRLSAKTFTNWSPKYGLVLGNRKDKSWIKTQIDFTYIKGHKKDPYFTINSIFSSVNVSYQHEISEGIWVGGFMNNDTKLNFPKSAYRGLFTNNVISYTMSQSIGPKINYFNRINNINDEPIELLTSLELPVLAYLIQPIYGHPYPEKFLREGTFTPMRSNMAWPMIKSGKMVSLNRFKHLRVEFGLFLYTSDKFKFGAVYQGELYYANANGKAVSLKSSDFMATSSYLY